MKTINRIVFFAVFALCLAGTASASRDRAFFWEVKTDKATVYLLGSIHFANKSFYPLRKSIVQAFDSSDHLVVEVDMSSLDPRRYQAIIADKGVYRNDDTIKDHLSPETWKQLTKYLERANIPVQTVERFRPGVIVLMLTSAEAVRLGYTPDAGIDMYFINRARGDKNIISLETLEQQIDALLDVPDADLLLKEQFLDMDESGKMMHEMVSLWKQGDEEGMNDLLFKDALEQYPSLERLYQGLFYERNKKMAEKITSFIEDGGSYFVIVGAGHLIGEHGIISLLRQAGYESERR